MSSNRDFPKQDRLDGLESYGNFIFAPLFGRLVSKGKTVFVDPYTLNPYKDQWKFLKTVKRAPEPLLDEIIELNASRGAPNPYAAAARRSRHLKKDSACRLVPGRCSKTAYPSTSG